MNLLKRIINYFTDYGECYKCDGIIKYSYYNAKLNCDIYQCNKCKIEYK